MGLYSMVLTLRGEEVGVGGCVCGGWGSQTHFTRSKPSQNLTDKTRKGPLYNFADNAGPDQPMYSRRLIWSFVVRLQNQWKL